MGKIQIKRTQTLASSVLVALASCYSLMACTNKPAFSGNAGQKIATAPTPAPNPADIAPSQDATRGVLGQKATATPLPSATAPAPAPAPVAPTCTLTTSAAKVAPGATIALILSVTGAATGATVENQAVATTGATQTVTVAATATYHGTVTGAGGTGSCQATVTVPAAPTCQLQAVPATVRQGDTTVLTATLGGEAAGILVDGTPLALSPGTMSATPSVTHTYQGTVQGQGGTGTCSVTVTVLAPVSLSSGQLAWNTASSQGYVWLVSMQEQVFRIKLDQPANTPMDQWTIPNGNSGGCGHRTYVSEIGLLINDGCNQRIYRINDDTPNTAQLIWTNPDTTLSGGGVRMCVTSFKLNGQPYIGAAYMGPNGRRFVKIPIDKTLPTQIDTTKAAYIDVGTDTANWGYSCFIDQTRNVFWSAYVESSPFGLDLTSNTALTQAASVNGAYSVTLPAPSSLKVGGGQVYSYAMSGDQNGNLLTGGFLGNNFYSAAYDPVSNSVIATNYSAGSNIVVADDGCFSTLNATDCAAKTFVYPVPAGTNINALSSLNDGRVIGIQRTSSSAASIWSISLKNPKDLSQGLNMMLLQSVPAPQDFYMYTDFTGATAYAVPDEVVEDLTQVTGFVAGRPARALTFNWATATGTPDPFLGLTLKVRCYTKGATTLPDFTVITPVANASSPTNILSGSCTGLFDQVDVRTEPTANGGSNFSRIGGITINGTL